jgi:hypothetical protein
MRAKSLTLLLALVFSIAMAASADAMDSSGTMSHVDLGDHGKPDNNGKTGDYGKPYDHGKPLDHDKPKDHGKGTVVVTVLGPKGRPVPGASISMDGRFVGSTNLQGKLSIPNVTPGYHRISAAKTSWHEKLSGSTQVKIIGKQTAQTSIKLSGGWR